MTEYKFSSYGTLPTPGVIGRIVRFLMAGLCANWLVILATTFEEFSDGVPKNAMLWVLIILAFHLLPPVMNIGFGKIWHSRPQFWFFIIFYISSLIAGNIEGTLDPTFSGVLLWGMSVYVFTHLGLSFLLSSILATPGCEMRSIPHLAGLLSGKKSQEHFCPGFIDKVDKWERKTFQITPGK